jgi:hypothetical protein
LEQRLAVHGIDRRHRDGNVAPAMAGPARDDLASAEVVLVDAATISVIRRAVRFLSVSASHFTASVPAFR